LAAHVVFWIILAALLLQDHSLDLFGIKVGVEMLCALFFIPPLELVTWRTVCEMPPSRLKRYLRIFQAMGFAFWIFNAVFLCMLIIHR